MNNQNEDVCLIIEKTGSNVLRNFRRYLDSNCFGIPIYFCYRRITKKKFRLLLILHEIFIHNGKEMVDLYCNIHT